MLDWQYRLYFWGIHGIFTEVAFTCLYDQVFLKRDQALVGHSSLWSFLIFGLAPFLIGEPLHNFLKRRHFNLPLRLLMYVLTIYAWEFCWGLLLVPWGANSWSYDQHRFNFMGIITLEYAPWWALAAVVFEYMLHIMDGLEEQPTWKKKR